jgi:hypothetical protein
MSALAPRVIPEAQTLSSRKQRTKKRKLSLSSNNLEVWSRILGMEIFVGTYMRRRSSPCRRVEAEVEKAEMGLFLILSRFSGVSIFGRASKIARLSPR